MHDFLKIEYERCLDLIKHYDARHVSLVKFSTTISTSAISLVVALYTLNSGIPPHFWALVAVLMAVAALGLLVLFLAMTQNRLYFIYPARQVNAIRRAMLSRVTSEFSDNQMYVTTQISAFKFRSLHSFMNLLVSFQIGSCTSLSWFAAAYDSDSSTPQTHAAVVLALVVTLVIFASSGIYLVLVGSHPPDKAIHSVDPPP
jgi:hypothetical protein